MYLVQLLVREFYKPLSYHGPWYIGWLAALLSPGPNPSILRNSGTGGLWLALTSPSSTILFASSNCKCLVCDCLRRKLAAASFPFAIVKIRYCVLQKMQMTVVLPIKYWNKLASAIASPSGWRRSSKLAPINGSSKWNRIFRDTTGIKLTVKIAEERTK